jgi:four helix bundle protein
MTQKKQQQNRPTSARGLDVRRVILELIRLCRPLIERIRRFNKRTGDQFVESLFSTLQNTDEAMRRIGRDRPHLLTVALGSCDEVRSILDGVAAVGVVTADEHQEADLLADRICAMLYRLREKSV